MLSARSTSAPAANNALEKVILVAMVRKMVSSSGALFVLGKM